ncbi:MAG TPA: 16S rRNA (cytosine(1402)-N(4))-methyltransferase RsmH [Candidatus Tyrphobacter sp.]
MSHVPVLQNAVLEYLAIRPEGIYVDATFGGGWHSRAILERLGRGRLIALDADPEAAARTRDLVHPSFTFVHANFRDLTRILAQLDISRVDGVLFDLGVSSMQFDDPRRGFSVTKSAPLDMRMNPYSGRSAYDVLANASERELAEIFHAFGEERAARRVARAIVARRREGELPTTTTDFARFISGVVQRPGHRERLHPATRIFQALRIAVNEELDALHDGLTAAVESLREGGRVVAISFHSLEDRIVKQMLRADERIDVLTKKPVLPSEREIAENPRARSAKLRAGERRAS